MIIGEHRGTEPSHEEEDMKIKRKPRPIYFFLRDRVEFGWLSNFYPAPFTIDGVVWSTVEHFYQASKTQDPDERRHVWGAWTASEAKAKGGRVTLRSDWEEVKYSVMDDAVCAKFSQHLDLMEKLLATGDRELVEDSPYDSYWGTGRDGAGKNMLGHILMDLRQRERDGENYTP